MKYTEQQTYALQLIDNMDMYSNVDGQHSGLKFLAHVSKSALTKIARATSKQNSYNKDEIIEYIDGILSRGFHSLQPTRLADNEDFIDAQKLKWWMTTISERVELSEFSTNKFKSKTLRLQRSAIAQSKTLHELRQAVNAMIGPLYLLRQHETLLEATSPEQRELEDAESVAYTESILLELEQTAALAAERKRVLDELLTHYSEAEGDIELLRKCESAKKQHGLSDVATARLFGMSRTKLLRLRSDIVLN